MKNPKVIYTILAISILLNAFLLGVIIFDKQQSSKEEVKEETAALSIDNITKVSQVMAHLHNLT